MSEIYEIKGGPMSHVITHVHGSLDEAIEKAKYLSVNEHNSTLLAVAEMMASIPEALVLGNVVYRREHGKEEESQSTGKQAGAGSEACCALCRAAQVDQASVPCFRLAPAGAFLVDWIVAAAEMVPALEAQGIQVGPRGPTGVYECCVVPDEAFEWLELKWGQV